MNAPPATTAPRAPAMRAVLPQRVLPGAGASDFKVLRTNRVPQQLSLFERPLVGR
jgi:hypothetical protein